MKICIILARKVAFCQVLEVMYKPVFVNNCKLVGFIPKIKTKKNLSLGNSWITQMLYWGIWRLRAF